MSRQRGWTGERWSAVVLLTVLASSPLAAETGAHAPAEAHHGKSADEVAKELANPNNDLAKLTFKNQFFNTHQF